jgi:hypothetical protein
METHLIEDLGKLIIPVNSLWEVKEIKVEHESEEIYVFVEFKQDYYKDKGKKCP